MAALLNTCTTIEQRGVVCFLWAKNYGSKGYPQRNAAHVRWTWPVTSSNPLKQDLSRGTLSWRWYGWKSSARVVPTATKRILRRRFPGTCETVGQVLKFVWRLCWKINVVCMSLSPFDSFQSRFVTYLNRPRINNLSRLPDHYYTRIFHSVNCNNSHINLLWSNTISYFSTREMAQTYGRQIRQVLIVNFSLFTP